MADATGEAKHRPLRVTFDGGLLAYRKLDDALDLITAMAAAA